MCIAKRHLNRLVAHDFLNRPQIHSCHRQAAGESVTQAMPRFVWVEYLAWLVTLDVWERFINDVRADGWQIAQLMYALVGIVFAVGDAVATVPHSSPFRWIAWTPFLGADEMFVDAAVARGFSVVRGSSLVHVRRTKRRTAAAPYLITFGGISIDPAFGVSALPPSQEKQGRENRRPFTECYKQWFTGESLQSWPTLGVLICRGSVVVSPLVLNPLRHPRCRLVAIPGTTV